VISMVIFAPSSEPIRGSKAEIELNRPSGIQLRMVEVDVNLTRAWRYGKRVLYHTAAIDGRDRSGAGDFHWKGWRISGGRDDRG
jgi:hypothetical protein